MATAVGVSVILVAVVFGLVAGLCMTDSTPNNCPLVLRHNRQRVRRRGRFIR